MKFKVTLEMLTPKVKKKNLHHSYQVSENDINDLRPQNEKTTFYYKHCMHEILCDFGTICFNIIFFTQIAVAFDTFQQQQS